MRSTNSTTKALQESSYWRSTPRSMWLRTAVAARKMFDTAASATRVQVEGAEFGADEALRLDEFVVTGGEGSRHGRNNTPAPAQGTVG